MRSHQKEFIEMILAKQVLRFGDFTLKSGRTSPYFFNAGLINDGGSLARLGAGYAQAIVDSGTAFDMLFGPAYKGIPLATATAIAFAEQHRRNVPIAYNRKESKQHGEGGALRRRAARGPCPHRRRRHHGGHRDPRIALADPQRWRDPGRRRAGPRSAGTRPGSAFRRPGDSGRVQHSR